MDAFGKEYHLWMLGESFSYRSVFYQVLDAVSDEMFKRKLLMEKWYFIVKTIGSEKDMRTSGLEKIITIVSDSCYLSTTKNVEHGIGHVDGVCRVCIH